MLGLVFNLAEKHSTEKKKKQLSNMLFIHFIYWLQEELKLFSLATYV